MKLIERYLHVIATWLPKEQRDDILAELGEDIHARISDREAELGRELTDDDVAAVLKEYGPPVVVAGRYLPQRHLIGPAFFPMYTFVLKLVVLWILVPVFVLIVGPIVIATEANLGAGIVETVWSLVMDSVFSTGVITIVFALLERYDQRILYKWDPRGLPRVPAKKSATVELFTLRCTAVFEALSGILLSGGWIYVSWFRGGLNFNTVQVALAPIWRAMFVPILLLLLAGIPLGLVTLRDPSRRRLRSGFRIVIDAYTLALLGILALPGTWLRVTASGVSAADLAQANQWTNMGVGIGLGFIGIIVVIDAATEARRFWVSSRTSSSPGTVLRPAP
jgi:hypothetical protein